MRQARWIFLLTLLTTSACGGDDDSADSVADFVAVASDFECILDWPAVRNIRLTNKLGRTGEALALAENPEPGKEFPVGTIIQLFPGEAMVKRGPDFDPDNNNWEYFELDVSSEGSVIRVRGRDDVINRFGGQCFSCHAAARDFDFICEKERGCIPLPLTDELIEALQISDPRCQ